MPDQHLFDTVRFLLSYQNGDGGWATYENCRGWSWYELLNPSEVGSPRNVGMKRAAGQSHQKPGFSDLKKMNNEFFEDERLCVSLVFGATVWCWTAHWWELQTFGVAFLAFLGCF